MLNILSEEVKYKLENLDNPTISEIIELSKELTLNPYFLVEYFIKRER